MSILCEIIDIFPGTWGIVEQRRSEIEGGGGFGSFERILEEEIAANFFDTESVAKIMNCRPSTARKWMHESDARYIEHKSKHLFYREDANDVAEKRKQQKAKKEAA